ncbi:MAG: ABC transporter permease [Planctomycetales bacterium]
MTDAHDPADQERPEETHARPGAAFTVVGALWKKAALEAWIPLVASVAILLAFCWIYVWIIWLFEQEHGALSGILRLLPSFVEDLVGLPLADLASPAGKLAMLYVDAVTVFTCVGWSIGRGSDVVSGEIGRGTMELLLAQPVRRTTVLFIHAVVTTLGAAVLAVSTLAGLGLGMMTVPLEGSVSLWRYVPSAINLFYMMFFLAGVTTLASSWDSERWRTIGLACGFFVISLIVKMVARLWEDGSWLIYLTFLGAFEPHHLALKTDQAWALSLRYDGALLAGGLACYVAAALIFSRRDLPAPL